MADDNKTAASETSAVMEFPLTKPINAYGEMISVLKIRKPTGADLIRVGNPVKFYPFAKPPLVEHDMPRMIEMIARLANVPSSSLEQMDPNELTSLAWQVSGFFIPAL